MEIQIYNDKHEPLVKGSMEWENEVLRWSLKQTFHIIDTLVKKKVGVRENEDK